MKNFLFFAVVFATLGLMQAGARAGTYSCDGLGNCSGNGASTYTDSNGTTTGVANGDGTTPATAAPGATPAPSGQINTSTDAFGHTSGTVGNQNVDVYTDAFGNTSGYVGNKAVSCYTDGFGTTTCN